MELYLHKYIACSEQVVDIASDSNQFVIYCRRLSSKPVYLIKMIFSQFVFNFGKSSSHIRIPRIRIMEPMCNHTINKNINNNNHGTTNVLDKVK